jgi:hypothetical protein
MSDSGVRRKSVMVVLAALEALEVMEVVVE